MIATYTAPNTGYSWIAALPELNVTSVVSINIDQASAKVRGSPPGNDEADHALPVWAGVLPMQEVTLSPVRDELMTQDIAVPEYVT